MRKKELFWICVLLIVGGIYIRYFSHWFEKPEIAISASQRPMRHGTNLELQVVFALNGDYNLTSVKVVPMKGDQIDSSAVPAWHFISDSNSVPIRAFRYGQTIHGMKPALKGVHPDALTPGVVYRLILTTDNGTGHKDFKL
jgi:hypothetical protein